MDLHEKLHDKLIGWADKAKRASEERREGQYNGEESSGGSERYRRRIGQKNDDHADAQKDEAFFLERLRRRKGTPQYRRMFLLRLAVALHSYGSSAPRTEYLIEKAADRIGLDVHVAIFPSLIAISFPSAKETNDQETHLLTVEGDLDIDKLSKADRLANEVGEEGHEVVMAYWQLKSIATSQPAFGFWIKQLSYALLAGTAAPLFFDGNMWDALAATVLGLGVGLLEAVGAKHPVVSQLSEFIAATFISFFARVLTILAPASFQFCYFAMTLAALVWLLPGLSITIGVSELVAKSSVSGTTRIVSALFSALQLGFGMAVGERLVWWDETSLPKDCPGDTPSPWWQILWFTGYTAASNVLLSARWQQWPGMFVVSAFGWLATLASEGLGGDASSIIAAFVIGVTGTIYSSISNDLPLAMKTSGILLLVPGGVGVQGVAAILSDDVLSGTSFVFDMMIVGISITIGLLLAKIVCPNGLFGATHKRNTNTRSTLANQLQSEHFASPDESDDEDDEEEHMAI